MRIGRFILGCLALFAFAAPAVAGNRPPTADEVFHLKVARSAAGGLSFDWTIAPGTYLYRSSLMASAGGAELALQTPPGETKDDPNFGPVEIYHGHVVATLPQAPATGTIAVAARGCAEQGICYPAITKTVDPVSLAVSDETADVRVASTPAPTSSASQDVWSEVPPSTETLAGDPAQDVIRGSFVSMVAAFVAFGVLIGFTPCVFPMLPILAGLLAGNGQRPSAGRSALMAASYALAAATAYGAIGVVAGWTGASLQLSLQNGYVLGFSAVVFVLLALSMYGLFELRLPVWLRRGQSTAGRPGSIFGAAVLGFGSALVVSPCVTPPFAAAILYAGQSGDALRGGAALFALGLGMELPLIAIAIFGARLLPKSGPWLVVIKPLFGTVFLAIAILIASRLLPAPLTLLLWGALALGTGVFLGAIDPLAERASALLRLRRTAGLGAVLYGALLIIGASAGADDPLRPLGFLSSSQPAPAEAAASTVHVSSLEALRQALDTTSPGHRALLSFTADWCTSCKSNEALFQDPALRREVAGVTTINADVTRFDTATRQLMTRYGVVGPPTLLVVDRNGEEVAGSRTVGPLTRAGLRDTLIKAGS